MADRFPLIVDSSSQQIKELPDGDSMLFGDNEYLKLGDSQDLLITHDGSDSYIIDNGQGSLVVAGSGVYIKNAAYNEQMISAIQNAQVELYYDNSKKIATTTSGVEVTGQMKATQSAFVEQVALTSGTNVTWNADTQGNAFLLLGHNVTMGKASNGNEGQIIQVEIAQPGSGGPYTVAWHTDYEFAASTAPTMTATASKTDIFTFRYNGTVWLEIGRVQNMAQT